MNGCPCDKVSEKLVDYADGELSATEASAVAKHLAACESCRAQLDALRSSLDLARLIWQDAEKDLHHLQVPTANESRPLRLRWTVLVAASIVFLLAGAMVLFVFLRPDGRTVSRERQPTLAEFQRAVERTGVAAQLLAAADLLSEQPGGRTIARERYLFIAETYADVDVAAEARSRLRSISERRVTQ